MDTSSEQSRRLLRTPLIGFVILLGASMAALWFYVNHTSSFDPSERLAAHGDVSDIELLHQGHRLNLSKVGGRWTVSSMDERPAPLSRVNVKRLTHFLDILQGIARQRPDNLQIKPLEDGQGLEAGFGVPQLAVNMGWQTPAKGVESWVFGREESEGRKAWVAFPLRKRAALVSAAPLQFLAQEGLQAMLDRHLTTFETDDVEEWISEGSCRKLHLYRDGAQWLVKAGNLSPAAANEYLDGTTALLFDGAAPDQAPTQGAIWCTVIIKGREGRQETLILSEGPVAGLCLARNTAFAGLHTLPCSRLTLLR